MPITEVPNESGISSSPCGRMQSLDDIRGWIATVSAAPIARSRVPWSVAHTLDHLAQSVEMSLRGYPLHKVSTLRSAVGVLAFAAFKVRGSMRSHDLTAHLPGAPELLPSSAVLGACGRLLHALDLFELAGDTLRDHFAYGRLTRQDYIAVHCAHVLAHADGILLA
jgi:hypothetical protein